MGFYTIDSPDGEAMANFYQKLFSCPMKVDSNQHEKVDLTKFTQDAIVGKWEENEDVNENDS